MLPSEIGKPTQVYTRGVGVRRGWRNSDKKLINNSDRWSQIIEQVQSRPIAFYWVKPNSGNRWHDEATRLATQAASGQDEVEEQSLF